MGEKALLWLIIPNFLWQTFSGPLVWDSSSLQGLSQAHLSMERFVFWHISKDQGYQIYSDSDKRCGAVLQSAREQECKEEGKTAA